MTFHIFNIVFPFDLLYELRRFLLVFALAISVPHRSFIYDIVWGWTMYGMATCCVKSSIALVDVNAHTPGSLNTQPNHSQSILAKTFDTLRCDGFWSYRFVLSHDILSHLAALLMQKCCVCGHDMLVVPTCLMMKEFLYLIRRDVFMLLFGAPVIFWGAVASGSLLQEPWYSIVV